MTRSSQMDHHAMRSNRLASLVYHTLVLLGDVGMVCTTFVGIRAWTETAALLLMLAGLLTLVYPHVGMYPRYARWAWGQPPRSLVPWRNLALLLLICLLYVSR